MTDIDGVRSQTISLGDDGIVRLKPRPGVFALTLDDAKEVIQFMAALCGGVPRPALVDMRALRSLSAECRRYFAGPETARVQSAVALLVQSPVTRAIGNFFMGLNKPLAPTRMFTAEGDALGWLRGFLA